MPTIAESISAAIALHRAGRLREAQSIYRQTLEVDPRNHDAWHLLGVAECQEGRFEHGAECIRRALDIKPDWAEAHFNLANALRDQRRLAEAATSYERVLTMNPGHAPAVYSLGNVWRDLGNLDDAVVCYRRALDLKPDSVEALCNLSYALAETGQRAEAEACLRRALQLKPGLAGAHNNLGNLLGKLGRFDEAVACFHRALELEPRYAQAHSNLGIVYGEAGRTDEAEAALRRALGLNPGLAEPHNNLGNILRERGALDEAVACYQRSLHCRPDYAGALNNLGIALREQGRLSDAIASFRRAIEINPTFTAAHSNLLYALIFSPDHNARSILQEHRLWNRRHAEPLAASIRPHTNYRNPDRPLRVGYVSPDFREHAESFFTVPLLSAHDHHNFEIFCYADGKRPDGMTARIRSCADVWRETVALDDAEFAELIRNDGIDILVDLAMHMGQNRLLALARKPAPVQVCWLAYQGTTGLSTMDYRLTDRFIDPPGEYDDDYTEVSYSLPYAFWCYDPLATGPAVNALPALDGGQVTFGCLNNFCKVNEHVLALWARVLRAVDHSRLVLLAPEGSARERTAEVLERAGVTRERLTFVGRLPRGAYLELHHRIDIALDTFPYTGQTTSLDAFWMGVPVVNKVGQTAPARAGRSLLQHLGLPELAAQSPEQFVSVAVALATDLPRLASLRATLRQRLERSPLMDSPRFARGLEAAYRAMWRRWCVG
jgi:predicted O-linked N-acetylglucosamine transferase (SPINDLY family)